MDVCGTKAPLSESERLRLALANAKVNVEVCLRVITAASVPVGLTVPLLHKALEEIELASELSSRVTRGQLSSMEHTVSETLEDIVDVNRPDIASTKRSSLNRTEYFYRPSTDDTAAHG